MDGYIDSKLLLNAAILVVNGVIGIMVKWALTGVRDINKKLGEMNGSIRGMKIWQEEHEKLDTQRESRVSDNFDSIRRELDKK